MPSRSSRLPALSWAVFSLGLRRASLYLGAIALLSTSNAAQALARSEALSGRASTSTEPFAAMQARVDSPFYMRSLTFPPRLAADNAQWNAQAQRIQFWVRNTGTTTQPAARWTLARKGVAVGSGDIKATTIIEGTKRLFQLPDDEMALAAGEYELTGELTWKYESDDYAQPFALSFKIQ